MKLALHFYLFIFTLSLSLLFSPFCSNSQTKGAIWAKLYTENLSDVLHTFYTLPNSDVIFAGWTNVNTNQNEDIILVRINENGDILWQYSYGANDLDYAQIIAPTIDKNIVVGCQTRSFGAGSSEIMLLKVDTAGNILWQKTYGTYDDNAVASVIPTSDGGFLVGGWSYLGSGRSHEATVFKTDANGNLIWSKHYGTEHYEGIRDMTKTHDGNYIFVAITSSDESQDDIWVVKIDPNGNIIWQKSFGGDGADVPSTILFHNGNYYIIGVTDSYSNDGKRDMFLLVIDENGNVQWAYTYPDSFSTNIINAHMFKDNKILAIGSAFPKSSWYSDLLITLLDVDGQFEKGMLYGGNDSELGFCINEYVENTILAGGYSYSFTNGNSDIILIRTDENLHLPYGDVKFKGFELDSLPQPVNMQVTLTFATIDTTSLTVNDANLIQTPMNLEMRNLNVIGSGLPLQSKNDCLLYRNEKNQLVLRLNEVQNQTFSIRISNLLGQEVARLSIDTPSNQIEIPIENLGNGFYFITIDTQLIHVPFVKY